MNVERALVVHLRADPTVTDLLGADPGARMHALFVPQKQSGKDQMPCFVYSVVGESRGKTYCGTDRLSEVMIVLDHYGVRLSDCRALSNAVRTSILDFRGLMGGLVRVRDVTFVSSIVLADMEPGLLRVSDTFSIWCEE